MYAFHKDFLELELMDMKLHGSYRIVSVDNDVVSFSDKELPLPELPYDFGMRMEDLLESPPEIFKASIPPIVHITMPKNSNIVLQKNEPLSECLNSGYIRVLIFSSFPESDINIILYIDDIIQHDVNFEFVGNDENFYTTESPDTLVNMDNAQSTFRNNEGIPMNSTIPPLWIAKWDNSKYKDNKTHEMKIKAIDKNNLEGEHKIIFRMDNKRDEFGVPYSGSLFLRMTFTTTVKFIKKIYIYINYRTIT